MLIMSSLSHRAVKLGSGLGTTLSSIAYWVIDRHKATQTPEEGSEGGPADTSAASSACWYRVERGKWRKGY